MILRENLGCLQFTCGMFVFGNFLSEIAFRVITKSWSIGIPIVLLISILLLATISLALKIFDVGFDAGWDLASTPMKDPSKDLTQE